MKPLGGVKPTLISYKKSGDQELDGVYSNQLLQMMKPIGILVAAATVLSCIHAAPTNMSHNNRLPFAKRGDSYQCSSGDNPSLMVIRY